MLLTIAIILASFILGVLAASFYYVSHPNGKMVLIHTKKPDKPDICKLELDIEEVENRHIIILQILHESQD